MQIPVCVITGCDLLFKHINAYAHGDLWKIGHTYIFNAVTSDGQTLLRSNSAPTRLLILVARMLLTVDDPSTYWHRRGTVVVDQNALEFNTAAAAFLQEGGHL